MHRYLAEAHHGVETPFSAYSLSMDPYDRYEKGMRNRIDRLCQLDRILSDIDRVMMTTPDKKRIQIKSRSDGASRCC